MKRVPSRERAGGHAMIVLVPTFHDELSRSFLCGWLLLSVTEKLVVGGAEKNVARQNSRERADGVVGACRR